MKILKYKNHPSVIYFQNKFKGGDGRGDYFMISYFETFTAYLNMHISDQKFDIIQWRTWLWVKGEVRDFWKNA